MCPGPSSHVPGFACDPSEKFVEHCRRHLGDGRLIGVELRDQAVPKDEWNDGATLVSPDDRGPNLTFLRVPEGKTVKNRMHLDLEVSGAATSTSR